MSKPWAWGAKKVHGIPKGYVHPCCGRRTRAKDELVMVYINGVELCEYCAEAAYDPDRTDGDGFMTDPQRGQLGLGL